jgi:hypothetical protein
MQKLELRDNLHAIISHLQSQKIIDFLKLNQVEKLQLINLFIESKAGYDRDMSDKNKAKIYQQFDTDKIYSSDNFTILLSFISTVVAAQQPNQPARVDRANLLSNNAVNDFYSFHKTLLSTFKIVDNLLLPEREIFDDSNAFSVDRALENGNLVFEVISDEEVTLKSLTEIFDSLEKLIDAIYQLFDKVEKEAFSEVPRITLVDSGSDINIGVKLPKKAANLLAQIIKEFWDLIVNNKSYRYGKKLRDIEKTITVLHKIKEAVDANAIDAVTAEVIKNGIIENAEKIVFNNTVTKQIMIESGEYSKRQLVIDQKKRFLIEDNKDNTEQGRKIEDI